MSSLRIACLVPPFPPIHQMYKCTLDTNIQIRQGLPGFQICVGFKNSKFAGVRGCVERSNHERFSLGVMPKNERFSRLEQPSVSLWVKGVVSSKAGRRKSCPDEGELMSISRTYILPRHLEIKNYLLCFVFCSIPQQYTVHC